MKHIIVVIALAWTGIAISAQPSCKNSYPSYYTSMQQLTFLPPLSGGMGFNELIGHIALDSICRLVEVHQIDSFMNARMAWDDTLKSMHKYMTTIVDENPLIVFGISNAVSEWRLSFPDEVRYRLVSAIKKFSPNPNLDLAIASCDYVVTVDVTDTNAIDDTSAQFAKTAIVVTGNVLDTLLGRKLPFCVGQQQTPQSTPGPQCLSFDVRREQIQYHRELNNLEASDSIVDRIIPQPSRQYLVFLRLTSLCKDSSSLYFTVFPVYSIGPSCGLFEIQEGRIVDEQNYFGLGPNPVIQEVVTSIEARIQQVKEWVP